MSLRLQGASLLLLIGGATYFSGFLPLTNFIFICFLFVLCPVFLLCRHSPAIKSAIWIVLILVAYVIAVYRPEGFTYPLVWEVSSLYEGGNPLQLYLNMSKGVGGLLLLVWFLRSVEDKVKVRPLLVSFKILLSGVLSIIAFSWFGSYVVFIPKFSSEFLYFFIINLFFTVIPEEVFFRPLLQYRLALFFKNRTLGRILAICLVGILFSLVHVPYSHQLFTLYLVAGLIYGIVFDLTNRLSMSIACHFGVNALNIVFFTYPLS